MSPNRTQAGIEIVGSVDIEQSLIARTAAGIPPALAIDMHASELPLAKLLSTSSDFNTVTSSVDHII